MKAYTKGNKRFIDFNQSLGKFVTDDDLEVGDDLTVDGDALITGTLTTTGGYTPGGVVTGTQLVASSLGADITGNSTVAGSFATTGASGTITSAKKLTVTSGGAEVVAGGLTVTAGGLAVSASGAAITGNSTVAGTFATTGGTGTITASAGVVATTGGVTATAGGVTATAGGVTATAGGLTATAGGLNVVAGHSQLACNGTDIVKITATNGCKLNLKCKSEELTLNTGDVTSTHAGWLPAGIVVAVAAYVTTAITGASANLSLGYTSAATAFCNAKGSRLAGGSTINSTLDGVMTGPTVLTAAKDLIFTSSSGNFTAGAVRVEAFYWDLTAPTS